VGQHHYSNSAFLGHQAPLQVQRVCQGVWLVDRPRFAKVERVSPHRVLLVINVGILVSKSISQQGCFSLVRTVLLLKILQVIVVQQIRVVKVYLRVVLMLVLMVSHFIVKIYVSL
jgi:hypothetical protein